MTTRRTFLSGTALAALGTLGSNLLVTGCNKADKTMRGTIPMVLSTWEHGLAANEEAWKILSKGGRALDAVEQGVRVSESDPLVTSVGYGGLPDRDGIVTLDACIMDENGNCGSVAFLQDIKNPISVARLVMEKTPHIMLAGDGAQKFALDNGFQKENLLTESSKKAWERWLSESNYKPYNWQNHDTIGMVAIDKSRNLSGACTTSGLAWKYHGRVGDSPIIGAGMYVDNEVGAACATGKGEAVIRISGSFLVVEMMRQGKSPVEACKIAVERILKREKDDGMLQVGFLALNKNGEYGAYSLKRGFQYALYEGNSNKLLNSGYAKESTI